MQAIKSNKSQPHNPTDHILARLIHGQQRDDDDPAGSGRGSADIALGDVVVDIGQIVDSVHATGKAFAHVDPLVIDGLGDMLEPVAHVDPCQRSLLLAYYQLNRHHLAADCHRAAGRV